MRLVVGAAIIRDAQVLVARRTSPPSAAGRWELPGGKVEPGEESAAALVREIREELACDIEVTGWLDAEATLDDGLVLRIALARLSAGEPQAAEHDRLRWLTAAELDGPDAPDWLEPDRVFLGELAQILDR